ncbi:hypothetical protein RhiJN_14868 [Ceratobasidium sp. AG-Ba]|nr:hypothetical protein RhiJN_14868 [Ceratobasidium sp. AG-Ba]
MTCDTFLTHNAQLSQDASMETTSRLLAALVNEGLVDFTVQEIKSVSSLALQCLGGQKNDSACVIVPLRQGTKYKLAPPAMPDEAAVITPELDPADIVGPVIIQHEVASNAAQQLEYRPEKVFDVVAPWICNDQEVAAKLRGELENSADNQEKWLQFALSHPPPALGSPLIVWEQHCIKGHPTHPMHRSFFANLPLDPVIVDDVEKLLEAEIIIISVPRDRIHIDGTFEESLALLLQHLEVATDAVSADQVLLPCFATQLPAIHKYFGLDATRVPTRGEIRGQRQAAMRTITIPGFPLHIKMALSYTITSAMRTMTPWTARMCIEISQLLQDIAPDPELLWIARKTAAACGANTNFEDAKHLCVMLREDVEPRALALGQCLVLPATLFEIDGKEHTAHAIKLFGLTTIEARKAWFRQYTRLYFQAILPPLLTYGICLEAHLQNVIARFDIETGTLRGFVYRDMGGLRMHTPTMEARGVRVKSAELVPGSVIFTDDLEAVWINAYHNFIANHLGGALRGMGLSWEGGWAIVREELKSALDSSLEDKAPELLAFMLQPYLKRKAFLKMKLAGVYRTRVYSYLPNPLAV